MLSFVDAIGHLSFVLSALSFIMRDMLMLRSVALVSAAVVIYYNYAIPAGPLWLVIFWLSVFALIHVYRIVELTRERREVHFTDEELELHQTVFQNFFAGRVHEDASPGRVAARGARRGARRGRQAAAGTGFALQRRSNNYA